MISNAVFLGSKKFGLELFKAMYYADTSINWTILCPPDRNDIRSNFEDFNEFAKKENIDLLDADSPQMILQYARDHNPDVMIVCGYYRILPPELFLEVRDGVWGVHNSLLPKYRGGSPLVWQMINNESTLGSSFFKFAKGVDDGAILDQVGIENTKNLTIKEAADLIEIEWVKRIPQIWRNFCEGSIEATEQIHLDATYCAQRQEPDGEIDWRNDASSIDIFIRAQDAPYPKAFFFFRDKKIKIAKHTTDNRIVYGTVGQVFEIREAYVTICCGKNTVIRLVELEVDGKTVPSNEILSSIKLRI